MESASAASATSKANAFAAAADSYTESGSYAQAIEAHFRAAEQFLLATSLTSDPDAVRTLRLLYANHTNKGKALQRRHATTATPASVAPSASGPASAAQLPPQPPHAVTTPNLKTPQPLPSQQKTQPLAQPLNTIPRLQHQQQHTIHRNPTQVPLSQPTQATIVDEIAFNKKQMQAQTLGVWTDNFEGTDMSAYGSRVFFVGQDASGSGSGSGSLVNTGAAGTGPSPVSKRYLSNTPATVPVESLDTSVVVQSAHSTQPNPGHSNNQSLRNALGQAGPSVGGRISGRGGMTGNHTTGYPSTGTRVVSNMSDTIDNSYYLLEEVQAKDIPNVEQEPPEETPFDKFWDVVETLVQKISLTTAGPLQALQQQTWNPSSMPMPGNSGNVSNWSLPKGVSVPGRPGYTAPGKSGTGANTDMFENLRGFKSPPTHPALTALSSPPQQAPQPNSLRLSPTSSMSGTTHMLNSYFVVPSNTGNNPGSGAAASYLGGTGALGFDPAHVYPEGVDVRLQATGGEEVIDLGSGQRISGVGARAPLASKVRAVGETRSSLGMRGKSNEELLIENEHLKQTVDILAKRVALLEKTAEENNMLKSSIIQFRQDVQKQAKRFGIAGSGGVNTVGAGGALPPRHNSVDSQRKNGSMAPVAGASTSSSSSSDFLLSSGKVKGLVMSSADAGAALLEAQQRISSLEDELKLKTKQFESLEDELGKYRDRWLKVKESARRKKELKTAELAASGNFDDAVGGTIAMDASLTSSINSGFTVGVGSGGGSGAGGIGSTNRGPSSLGKSGSPSNTPSPVRKAFSMPPQPLAVDVTAASRAGSSSIEYSPAESTPIGGASDEGPRGTAAMSFQSTVSNVPTAPPHQTKNQYPNSITPTMVAASLSTSVVVDSSAALLMSHLRDPSLTRGNISPGINISRSSSNVIHSDVPLPRSNNVGASAVALPKSDMAESGVSNASMFYSAHSFKPSQHDK
ncbi:hypothetical protein BC830DRAFT_1104430 [Chytriomyces sp. MP71]|nr:hypothetical protein BC830DRAFT_1104430 [Chytriomyces sp. MP71]